MKLSVFLKNKILNYTLPNEVSGSYSFDCGNDNKIINVEAQDGNWSLFSISDAQIFENNQLCTKLILENNKFFFIKYKEVDYLVYSYDNQPISIYKYGNDINLLIANDASANISYSFPYFKSKYSIKSVNNQITLVKEDNSLIYLNNKLIINNQTPINIGDEIQIFGLKIKFLSGNLLSINMIPNTINVNESTANLSKFEITQEEQPVEVKIVDSPLYSKDNYYSKSPRLRRFLEDKKIKMSQPPAIENAEDMPMILVIGPMLTMGMTTVITLATTAIKIETGQAKLEDSISQLLISFTMLISMILWPMLTKFYNKKQKEKKNKLAFNKYNQYLRKIEEDLIKEEKQERVIIAENLSTLDECLNFIKTKSMNFWDKRIDQNDFLLARVGIGREKLKMEVEFSEKEFSLTEEELEKNALGVIERHKELDTVPKGYSFYDNNITAIMGVENKKIYFVNNILLQFLTYYSYDDLKIVVFTSSENEEHWDYLRYLSHNFSDDKSIRFFGTTSDTNSHVLEYLDAELNRRTSGERKDEDDIVKPHYLILTDCYDSIKRSSFIKQVTELNDPKLGFSFMIIENKLSKLPSKCNSFITVGDKNSDILINTTENQEHMIFQDEVRYDINMYDVARIISNIPIEFESGNKSLPESINFLEMEKVGKVEQLNILNRWKTNDPINSLKAEVGVDENMDYMYLDLHEKYHGPHGLVAGMTGSGKSEFIITYILSMAINYSPYDVSFILIDYKGGGLAFAFENKQRGIVLPHLAGTITNLDKAEMDRTLVSINSEVKRRQAVFNEARDKLGESTIDIYKYQRFFKEGKLDEPISHLFIICDEFAELKSQQPDFMDNLISVARIGRSLGVHLILATQKPSGVVNDQIWSNSKFKVCLKVQDQSDSNEMLKRPDAASLKEAGRFYLQVGFDEYFALGQSAWAGAKYYPSDEIVRKIDKSVDFIDDNARTIKKYELTNSVKVEAQGEQLANIMNNVIEVAQKVNQSARKLWLDNIPPIILVENTEKKYNYEKVPYKIEAIIGEYDAPELQKQGLVKYNYIENGSTIIYGYDGGEREDLVNALIYSTCRHYDPDEVEFYIVDYGSESLRRYEKLPHVGGIVTANEDEKFFNLLKLIKEEFKIRKQLLKDYSGDYMEYIKNSGKKLPVMTVIFNNYDSINETYQNLYDDLPELVRDSERYGIVFIFTANAINSVANRIAQNFTNRYTFKLNDAGDYSSVFDMRVKISLRNIEGRGLLNNDGIHEFQTVSLVENKNELNPYINSFVEEVNARCSVKAKPIPTLPDVVTFDDVKTDDMSINSMPIGIEKSSLDIRRVDFLANIGNIVATNKLQNAKGFVKSLMTEFRSLPNTVNMVIDSQNILELNPQNTQNYYIDNFDKVLDSIMDYVNKLVEANSDVKGSIIIFGLDKFLSKVDSMKLTDLVKKLKEYEKICLIAVEAASKFKKYTFESWYSESFVNNEGLWVGAGVSNQSVLQINGMNKEMMQNIRNNMGWAVTENIGTLIKLIDFDNDGGKKDGE